MDLQSLQVSLISECDAEGEVWVGLVVLVLVGLVVTPGIVGLSTALVFRF